MDFEIADMIFRAPKRLIGSREWKPVNAGRKHTHRSYEQQIALRESIPRGVYFRALVYPFPKESATFQLECDLPRTRTRLTLYRLELKPLKPHVNKLYGPENINGVLIGAGITHEHLFYDSVTDARHLRVGQAACEQARVVHDPPQDFTTALTYVCSRINILNGEEVPLPEDQGILL